MNNTLIIQTTKRKGFHSGRLMVIYLLGVALTAQHLPRATADELPQNWRPSLAGVPAAQACARLNGLKIPAAEIALRTTGARVTSTELVTASTEANTNGEYCKVLGAIHPQNYTAPDIHFEVNLPSAWNEKSLQFGGGGFNGELVTGLGRYVKQPDSEATPLSRGYVTLGSDSGHQSERSFDASFFLSDEALRNFGHEQIKKTHDVAMHLVLARYGKAPRYNYFIGGSQGGHEAFDAIQRYPEDYQGVVAGYPAHNMVMLHLSANRYTRALYADDGAGWINPQKVNHFVSAIYQACDHLDGASDGVISNVIACRQATQKFTDQNTDNPIRCEAGADTGNTCLSDTQLDTLNTMNSPYELGFSVFPDDQGSSVFPSWTPFEGSTFFDGGFPNLGGEGPEQALQRLPGDATPKYIIAQDLTLDAINDFEPGRYAGRINEVVGLVSANSVNLDRFINRGGKLILVHGMVDDFIPVTSSIQYWQRLQGRYTDDTLTSAVRFYTIPGMGHVTGPFNARLSSLSALENWVENDKAPDQLLATDANEATKGRTRPVCQYPQWPRYNGSGDINDSDSFSCYQ